MAAVAAPEIHLEPTVSQSLVPAGQPVELMARFRIRADAIEQGERQKINLALVVDTSGSMQGQALQDAKQASQSLVDALGEGDLLSVVGFGSSAEVVVPTTVLDQHNVKEIKAKIAAMEASGTTDMAGGLSAGLAELRQQLRPDRLHRVVLLSDGVPNDDGQLLGLAQSAGSQGISITAMGLGLDYDESLMAKLAMHSGGKYHFI